MIVREHDASGTRSLMARWTTWYQTRETARSYCGITQEQSRWQRDKRRRKERTGVSTSCFHNCLGVGGWLFFTHGLYFMSSTHMLLGRATCELPQHR